MSLSSDAMAESLEEFNGTFLDREESGDDGIASVAQISKPATGNEDAIVLARVINAPGPCVAGYRIDARTRLPLGSNRRKRSEEHTSELQSHSDVVCRLLLEKKKFYSL